MIDFETYDRENPHIWEAFQRYAREAKAKGFKHYSANGIFEIMRWHSGANGNDEFKINNTYRPDYARKMMWTQLGFEGFFRIRRIQALRAIEGVGVDDKGQTYIL